MPDSAPEAAEITELLPEVMRRLFGGRSIPAGLRELTIPQARALRLVATREGLTMGELARELHITLGAATGLVDRVIQHGLVRREDDPRDKRVVRLRLTESGRRSHAAATREVRSRAAAALGKLSGEQRAKVVEALAMLREALSETSTGNGAR
jgi:DNA-binding MarR family transcriptional regulator